MQTTLLILGIIVFLMMGMKVRKDLKLIPKEVSDELYKKGLHAKDTVFSNKTLIVTTGLLTTIITAFFALSVIVYYNWVTLIFSVIVIIRHWIITFKVLGSPIEEEVHKSKSSRIINSVFVWTEFIYSAIIIALVILS